jgi:hypothetical protein
MTQADQSLREAVAALLVMPRPEIKLDGNGADMQANIARTRGCIALIDNHGHALLAALDRLEALEQRIANAPVVQIWPDSASALTFAKVVAKLKGQRVRIFLDGE